MVFPLLSSRFFGPCASALFPLLAFASGCGAAAHGSPHESNDGAMPGAPPEPSVPGEEGTDGSSEGPQDERGCDSFAYRADAAAQALQVTAYRERLLTGVDCFATPQDPECQNVWVGPYAAREAPKEWCASRSQRVLVIDNAFDVAAHRYGRRVLAWKAIDPTTLALKDPVPTLPVTKKLADVLGEIGQSDFFLPSMAFVSKLTPGTPPRKVTTPSPVSSHGGTVLAAIADYNPYAQFVLLEKPSYLSGYTCDGSIDGLTKGLQNVTATIKSLVQRYNVSFINYSAGVEDGTIRDDVQRKCGAWPSAETTHAIHVAVLRYIEGLASGVIFVQSANPGSEVPLRGDEPELLSDCAKVPNRVRVSYLERGETPFPRGGASFAAGQSLLGAYEKNIAPCVDMYANAGSIPLFERPTPFEYGPFPYLFGGGQINGSPIDFMTSSWAAPVGLSILNHYKQKWKHDNNGIEPSRQKILELAGRLLYDPIRNGETDTCRLFPEYCAE